MRSTFSTHPVKHDRAVRESGTVLSDYCIWSIRRRLYLRTDFPVSLGGYNTDMLVAAKAPHWRSADITPCLAIWLMRLTQLAALHRQKLINLGGQQYAGGIGAAMALNPHRAKKRLMAPLVADSSHGMAVLQRKNNGRPPGHQSCPASWRISMINPSHSAPVGMPSHYDVFIYLTAIRPSFYLHRQFCHAGSPRLHSLFVVPRGLLK